MENDVLPVWCDKNGMIHHDVPPELQGLHIGEQLLIQPFAPCIPIVHIKNDAMGINGYVCSFLQQIGELAESLPILPSDVRLIRMTRNCADKTGDTWTKVHCIRRQKVLDALTWLANHHAEHKKDLSLQKLVIDPHNLECMGDKDEMDLTSVVEFERQMNDEDDPDKKMVDQQKICF